MEESTKETQEANIKENEAFIQVALSFFAGMIASMANKLLQVNDMPLWQVIAFTILFGFIIWGIITYRKS